MYNKVVTTLAMILVLAGTVNAQYYSTVYSSPGTMGFINSEAVTADSRANFNYLGYMPGPVLQAPAEKSPSSFGFNYINQQIAPTFSAPSYSPSSLGLDLRPMYVNPTYGSGLNIGSINLASNYIQPTYGPGLGLGSLSLAAIGPRQIPSCAPFRLGGFDYGFAGGAVAAPIYATPSRALFNTEMGFSTFYSAY